ncbi:MAG: heat-inducible transcriptional repressor HrcA [Symbiobacteriia bacterium]
MDARKERILQAIIDDYVATAEPVGSRTLARKYRLGVSPATIRNEMADLEEQGYLEQPHTSAGRIPSDKGYRYYVDSLMESKDLSPAEQERITAVFSRRLTEVDHVVRETAKLLSETTQYSTLVTGPRTAQTLLRGARLVPLADNKALLILVTEAGFVEDQIVDMPVEVTLMELQRISGLLDQTLRGQSLYSLSRDALSILHHELDCYRALLAQTLEFLTDQGQPLEGDRVYIGGASRILAQPEFHDIGKVKRLMDLLEEEQVVHDILTGAGPAESRVAITIGEEIRYREMADCSLVTATYRVGDQTVGRIGVLGPKRMEYAKVVSLVDNITQRLSAKLSRGD